MPRPRAEEQPATKKMQEAFWVLLEHKPYPKITVSDVTRTSGLNRTAFYYHYTNIAELAEDAIYGIYEDQGLIAFITRLIRKVNDLDLRDEYTRFVTTPEYRRNIHRVALITGPHGSTSLAKQLRDFIIDTWLELMGLDRTRLNPGQNIVLEFTSNGILGVISNAEAMFNEEGARWVARTQLPETVSKLINSLKDLGEDDATTDGRKPASASPTE
ncbi:TetR family transcriptional regulator [Bifidobacterium sp. SMB2]|uniref:TetR family transcriptional regulator n=1 Tax=Bifidobacterium saimiriisciurei TaxID=2661627 RepID=A0ABX0CF40_9BIFI|nr:MULTISPECIES: TetR/AcrR family transcriptional regulator [Bifidobacterium]NEG96602.1 TetR family transcriptional regulator [Bifidobacterium sp. SMB2]NEH12385.1 TetR family transcriptional regulator [Bifidobacterium saimiriisciurei]